MTLPWLTALMKLIANELLRRKLLPQPMTAANLTPILNQVMGAVTDALGGSLKTDKSTGAKAVVATIQSLLSGVTISPTSKQVPTAPRRRKRHGAIQPTPTPTTPTIGSFIHNFTYSTTYSPTGTPPRAPGQWVPNPGVPDPANVDELNHKIWATPGVTSPAWRTGDFVLLIDGTVCHWNGHGWTMSGSSAVA
jgi:hypothetical protein